MLSKEIVLLFYHKTNDVKWCYHIVIKKKKKKNRTIWIMQVFNKLHQR